MPGVTPARLYAPGSVDVPVMEQSLLIERPGGSPDVYVQVVTGLSQEASTLLTAVLAATEKSAGKAQVDGLYRVLRVIDTVVAYTPKPFRGLTVNAVVPT